MKLRMITEALLRPTETLIKFFNGPRRVIHRVPGYVMTLDNLYSNHIMNTYNQGTKTFSVPFLGNLYLIDGLRRSDLKPAPYDAFTPGNPGKRDNQIPHHHLQQMLAGDEEQASELYHELGYSSHTRTGHQDTSNYLRDILKSIEPGIWSEDCLEGIINVPCDMLFLAAPVDATTGTGNAKGKDEWGDPNGGTFLAHPLLHLLGGWQ